MSAILQIEHLAKSFGQSRIINDISFEVPQGSVFGFIGENGAGKPTTMRMILGLLKPDAGGIYVCGESVRYGMTATNRHLGYLPDVPEFYGYLRPKEYLRLCGEVVGLSDVTIKKRSTELLQLVGLNKSNKRISSFSRGMKQRLGVAQALINEPKLLICDEPTSALDPIGRKEILDILRQICGKTTVVFSTHILSDVERICDRVAVLHEGKIALTGTLAKLKERQQAKGLRLEFATPDDRQRFCALAAQLGLPGDAESAEGTEITLQTDDLPAAEATVLRLLADQGILPICLEVLAPTMENLFLEAVK